MLSTENPTQSRVLKAGVTAYYDTFSGMIRCHVISVTRLSNGLKEVRFRLLENRGAYKKGEELSSSTLWVVPAGARIKGQYYYLIGYYTVEFDEE